MHGNGLHERTPNLAAAARKDGDVSIEGSVLCGKCSRPPAAEVGTDSFKGRNDFLL